jgi:hypothetical protein
MSALVILCEGGGGLSHIHTFPFRKFIKKIVHKKLATTLKLNAALNIVDGIYISYNTYISYLTSFAISGGSVVISSSIMYVLWNSYTVFRTTINMQLTHSTTICLSSLVRAT